MRAGGRKIFGDLLWVDKQQTREKRERAEGRRGDLCATQASDVGSIPIARSINADDSIAFTSGKC